MIKSKEDIKAYFKRFEILHYFVRCIVNFQNEDMRKMIVNERDSLIIAHNGDKSANKIYYHIKYNNPKAGFFAIMKEILNYCNFAEYYNLIPVISWGDKILYNDYQNKESNAYERYFKQSSNCSIKELQEVQNIVNAKPQDIVHFSNGQNGYEYVERISIYGALYKKFIVLNDNMAIKIENTISDMGIDDNILGVHIRGTDYKKGYNRHPVFIPVNEYLLVIDELLNSGDYTKIFLATDDQEILDEVVEKLGTEKVLYIKEAVRSKNGNAVHYSEKERCSSRDLGFDVLKDVYILSRCGGFVGGLSNVSLFAQIVKKSYDKNYKHIEILDKGLNKNFNEF